MSFFLLSVLLFSILSVPRIQTNSPWAVRPVLPPYRLIGTASLWLMTFSRKARARCSFIPLMAWAVSRVFLKLTRRYEPRARALFAAGID